MNDGINGVEFLLVCVVPVALIIAGYLLLKEWARRK